MNAYTQFNRSRTSVVADVGRHTIRVGLTDEDGHLDHATVREYDPAAQSTISTALSAYAVDAGLPSLPRRAAIAVSGVPRGDIISVTKSRWILSRSGLTAMFQAAPLILNDFAANAWAMSDPACSGRVEPMSTHAVRLHQPGTYCIIGIGSGLGVAIMSRDEYGLVSVLPTEAGHMGLMDGVVGGHPVIARLRNGDGPLSAETLFSARGLLAVYRAMCDLRGRPALRNGMSELLSHASLRADPVLVETFDFFARAFWQFAGNLALAYGAWDGVILTGSITAALRQVLRRPELSRHFVVDGPYSRRLAQIPRATMSFRHAELEGAAVALLIEDQRRAAVAGVGIAANQISAPCTLSAC
ncbi:MAG: glucokinase [Sphingomicrobium sp.]